MHKLFKNILKLALLLVVLFALTLYGLAYYLEQHKTEMFSKFETWYHENHHGTLTFDDLEISTFQNFPNVAFELHNLAISDSISANNNIETLKIEELRLIISIQDMLQKKVELKALKIANGTLNIITEKDGATNKGLFSKKKNDSIKSTSNQNWLKENELAITIENFNITMLDYQKNKRIKGLVNNLSTDVKFRDSIIQSSVKMDIQMYEMGLNLYRGTFFNNVNVSGAYEATIYKEKDSVEIPTFDLQIGDQKFITTATLNTKDSGSFDIILENKATNFAATTNLLSQNIQKTLKTFHIVNPFYTYTTLQGSFKFRSNPLVKVYAATKNNTITTQDTIQIKKVNFKGSFVNRIYNDARIHTEDVKNLRINFDAFQGNYKGVDITLNKAKLKSTPEVKTHLDVDLNLSANTATLNSLLNSDLFLFKEGNFSLNSKFAGSVTDLYSVIDKTESTFAISKTKLIYTPHSLEIPIDTLHLNVNKKHAFLKLLKVPIKGLNHNLQLSGNIKNVSSLILEGRDPVVSQFDVYSDALVWEDFIYLFKIANHKISKEQKQDLLYFNEALKAIYKKLNPKLEIEIQEFQYQNFIIKKLTTGLQFKNINAININRTGFNYRTGLVGMNLNLDISHPNKTLFDVDFLAKSIDLGQLLKEFGYFGLSALEEAKKIEGVTSVDVKMKGVVDEQNGLETETLKGVIDFELNNVELESFEPIQKIGDKVFRKERFEDIKLAPIESSLKVSGRTVQIPLTEIRSTAFDLFLEGELTYDKKTNIWVAIPIENFKKRKDLSHIPEKTGYEKAGKKVFVQVKDAENGELNYKFHFNNKKQYEEKGMLDQYKDDKKSERQVRKLMKKHKKEAS